jgi:hypothetical protein
MTELLYGLDAAVRERVTALRSQRRCFWLDVSLGETTIDDLAVALALPERAMRTLRASADGHASRTFQADGESVVFALRCLLTGCRARDVSGQGPQGGWDITQTGRTGSG